MATNLALWQVDPFFSAAEEVQNSADRMASAYRTWKHTKGLVGSSSCHPIAKSTLEAQSRELVTALHTVKWQQEEFERAVESAMLTEQDCLGENTPLQHRQFVRAIKSQVLSISSELGDTFNNQVSQSMSTNAQGEGVNDLAKFLLGNRFSKSALALEDDVHIDPVEARQPYQNGEFSEKNCVHRWGLHVPSLNGSESGPICEYESVDVASCSPQSKASDINIRIFEEDYAPSEFSTTASETKSEAKGRSFFQQYASSEFSTSTSDGQSSDWLTQSLETDAYDLQENRKIGSLDFLLGFWGFWKNKTDLGKLQVSKSGFKRWKDGDATFGTSSVERVHECSPMLKAGHVLGTSKGFKADHMSENFDGGSNKYSRIETSDLNDILPCGFRGTPPIHGFRIFSFACSPARISAVFSVLILVGVYFWFVSTFFSEDTSKFPGDFPN